MRRKLTDVEINRAELEELEKRRHLRQVLESKPRTIGCWTPVQGPKTSSRGKRR